MRRQTLRRVLAAGGVVVLAACSTAHRNTARSTRSSTAPASTTVAPTTTTTPPPISYQVKRGDTLTSIAKFFGVSNASITAANHLANGDQLTVGQVLQIPRPPPAQLAVTPPDAPAGTPFTLNLTGAKAGETITFEIDAPDGHKFTGSPHTASPDGLVTTTYETSAGEVPGTYNIGATGDRGTMVRASFRLLRG